MDVPEISAEELKERLARSPLPVLLDVRLPWEHQLVAIAGSVLVPLPALPQMLDSLAPTLAGKEVVVYCHHGVRSLSGAAILRGAGIDAVSLEGGIDGWSATVDPALGRY